MDAVDAQARRRRARWLAGLLVALLHAPAASAQTLTDPSVSWATYFGGSGPDEVRDVAVDAAGYVYAVGSTSSVDLPMVAAFDATLNGSSDAFVVKIAPGGDVILFSSYLGGSGDDVARAVGLDAAGNLYVAGETNSPDFPVSANAVQPGPGGDFDGFLAVFDAMGSLLQATYLGGSGRDSIGALSVAGSGKVALRGDTESSDFPTVAAVQPAFGGVIDAFVSLVEPGGSSLLYSTYLGGSGDDSPAETGYGVAMDDSGGVLTCGTTESTDLPTVSAFQDQHGGGLRDGFLAKLAPSGATFDFATYFGRSRGDSIRACVFDTDQNIYFGVASRTYDLPVAPVASAPRTSKSGFYDTYLAKFDPTASQLLFATYWGGTLSEGPKDVEVDAAGRLHAIGQTESSDFPLVDPVQDQHGGGLDAFVTKLTPSGSAFVLSTFLGGSSDEAPYDLDAGLTLDSSGAMVLGGTTLSADFPTRNALDTTLGGASDGWIARIAPGPEIELELGGSPALADATARIVNRGHVPATVQVKLWIEDAGVATPLATGLPELQTVGPGSSLELLSSSALDPALPFPGTVVGARLIDPASGRVLSELECREVPCN